MTSLRVSSGVRDRGERFPRSAVSADRVAQRLCRPRHGAAGPGGGRRPAGGRAGRRAHLRVDGLLPAARVDAAVRRGGAGPLAGAGRRHGPRRRVPVPLPRVAHEAPRRRVLARRLRVRLRAAARGGGGAPPAVNHDAGDGASAGGGGAGGAAGAGGGRVGGRGAGRRSARVHDDATRGGGRVRVLVRRGVRRGRRRCRREAEHRPRTAGHALAADGDAAAPVADGQPRRTARVSPGADARPQAAASLRHLHRDRRRRGRRHGAGRRREDGGGDGRRGPGPRHKSDERQTDCRLRRTVTVGNKNVV